jgi:hypothetical protein
MAEYLQAPPRKKALGLLADTLTSGQNALNTVNVPYLGGLGGLLFGQAPQYLEDISYGMPAFRGGNVATGGLGTLTPDTRMLDVATLPFVGAGAAKAGQVGAKTLGKEVARQVETGTGLLGSNVLDPRQYMFIGEKSKAWDTTSNKVAKALEKDNVAPETIWSQTGNVKAPDGKWRQEISDVGSNITDNVYEGIKANKRFEGTMSTALEHPELYKAYPEIGNIKTSMYAWNKPEGSYMASDNPYFSKESLEKLKSISVGGPGTTSQKSASLHEIMHDIQNREGFARGGNVESFIDLANKKPMYTDANILTRMNSTYNDIDKAKEVFKERFNREPTKGAISLSLSGLSPNEILAKLENTTRTPVENYRRLAGEAESRLVQSRMNLTPEQRLQYYPYAQGQYGLDVPYNELIVQGLLK